MFHPVLAFHAELAAHIAGLRRLQAMLTDLPGVKFVEASLAAENLGYVCASLVKVESHLLGAFDRARQTNGWSSHATESETEPIGMWQANPCPADSTTCRADAESVGDDARPA